MQHVSFNEKDAAMLAAYDAALPLDTIDASEVTTPVNNNINDHIVGSSVTPSLTNSERGEQNSNNMLSEQSDIKYCKGRSVHGSSCTYSETDLCLYKKVLHANHCQSQSFDDESDCVTNKHHISYPEVQPANDNTVTAAVWPTTEVHTAPSSTVSIQRKSARRLLEKIKQTLQQNARVDTPTRLNRLTAVIEKCDSHCADVTDIGPFYGLPVKVKQLLETQRSITEFYREFSSVLFVSVMVMSCRQLIIKIHLLLCKISRKTLDTKMIKVKHEVKMIII